MRVANKEIEMDILRRGSSRDHGPTFIISGQSLKKAYEWEANVRWDHISKQIIIFVPSVPYGDGHTNHDYYIRLSLEDISYLVTLLGHAGSATDASSLRDHLRQQVPALVKLLACATSLVPTPMADSKNQPDKRA
jgi:hypothetical protein